MYKCFYTTSRLLQTLLHLAFFFFKFYLFIYLWLCWVFVSVRGLSLVVAGGGHSSSRRAGPSLSQPLLLRSTGSSRAGSAIVAHGPSRSAACGIFPDQGSNPCPPHWQADSQPLRHQGSPILLFFAELYVFSRPSFFKLTHNFIKICHNLLAQSPIWEHLGSFQSYLIINKAITYPFVILYMWEFIC